VNVNSHFSAAPVTLPIQLTNNHVYVSAAAGNRALWLLVDTGAATTLLNLRTAGELGLQLGPAFQARGGGDGAMEGAVLQRPATLVLAGDGGDVRVQAGLGLALDSLEPHEGRRIDGILAGDVLSRFVTEIDYRRERLRFHDADGFSYTGGGTRVPMEIRIGHPHVTATVVVGEREAPGDFVVDVGSSLGVSLTAPFVRKHAIKAGMRDLVRTVAGRGVGGAATVEIGRLAEVRIGSLCLQDVPATLFGDGAGVMTTGEYFEGNLGGDILRRFTLFFDFRRKEIIFG